MLWPIYVFRGSSDIWANLQWNITHAYNGTLTLQPGGGLQFPRGMVDPGWCE